MVPTARDVIVIGGGQSALAVSYYLRRTGLSWVVLDASARPGGAWRATWDSLRLFSPAQWSSLPGRLMPGGTHYYPTRDEAIAYLEAYEDRYEVPVIRPVRVTAVRAAGEALVVETDTGASWTARAVVSATGTWSMPRRPRLPGEAQFTGRVLHSAEYRGPGPFAGQPVIVVGGGNSGAQIVADLSDITEVTWSTRRPPSFLPDDIDGRYLFGEESARYRALAQGDASLPPRTLGEIVMVEPVRQARDRGALRAVPLFAHLTADGVVWPDGRRSRADAIILATGFRPALGHLASLGITEADGRVLVDGTRSRRASRVWLVGYGDWTGFASATLIGVGRSARATVADIVATLAASRA